MPFEEFQRQPNQTLLPWGVVDGQILWKDKPGAGETMTLSAYRDEYGYPGTIRSYAQTKTDADGRFAFDKVLPGRVQISRPIELELAGKERTLSAVFDGLYLHVLVRPGDPTPVILGGQGRTVRARLTGRATWDGVTIHFHPVAPHFGMVGDDDNWKAFAQFRTSPIGPLFFRNKLQPNADGTIEIGDVLPGQYQMFVSATGVSNYGGFARIRVDPERPGELRSLVDLGDIPVKPPEK